MSEHAAGVTTQELIQAAKKRGYAVAESTLERWRRLGLLPRPIERPGKGRRHGRVGIYPSVTTDQLLALLQIKKEDRRVAYWGWRLWGEGFDVAGFVRTHLVAEFTRWDEQLRSTLEKVEAGERSAIEEASRVRLNRQIAGRRRRIGPGNAPIVARVLFEVLAGRFTGAWFEPEDYLILDRFLGRAKRDEPYDEEEAEVMVDVLRAVGEWLNVPEFKAAAESASDADLIQVRDEIRSFFALAKVPGPVTYGGFKMWFIARKGSKKMAAFVERFLTDAEYAEQRKHIVETLRKGR